MSEPLAIYVRKLLTQEAALARELTCPLLVWETPPLERPDEMLLGTANGRSAPRPAAGEAVVFRVEKDARKQNAFPLGIAIGRTDKNDIAVADNSVSRFHAHLQLEVRTNAWRLFDAESQNGTFVGTTRLTKGVGVALADRDVLRLGDVQLRFLLPPSFIAWLKQKIAPS